MMNSMWFGVLALAAVPLSAAEVDFAHEIVPVLKQHCGQCHTGDQQKGGLSLNTRQSVLAGGESGPVVVVGQSGESELVARIATADEALRMPPEGPRVPPEQVALVQALDRRRAALGGRLLVRPAGLRAAPPAAACGPAAGGGRARKSGRPHPGRLPGPAPAGPAPADRRRHVCPPRLSRHHRPVAHARRAAGVPRRRRLGQAGAARAGAAGSGRRLRRALADVLERPAAERLHGDRLHHGRSQADLQMAVCGPGREHALRPVRPRADRAADGGECRLRPRHPLARRRQRRADGRNPVRPERGPVVPGHQPEVRLLPRQLHRPLEAR